MWLPGRLRFNVATSQSVTNLYTIDNGSTGGLGILTSQAQSGTISDTWSVPSSGGLDGVSRVAKSTDTVITRPAYGTAVGAATVTASLDGKPVSVQFDGPYSSDGTWRASLNLFPGSHTLSVSAVDLTGAFTASTNNSFTANGGATDTITNVYDGNGNVTQRIWVSSSGVTNRIQNLTYDAFDRLNAVTDRDAQNSGLNWTARYDGLGRRTETTSTVVVSNTPMTTGVSTVDSTYDPQAEFLELQTMTGGEWSLRTFGPDANGAYGGLNGVGGLDSINIVGHTTTVGVVQDVFGNVLASISNGVVAWNPTRVSSYGPVPGYESPALSLNAGIVQSLGWRGKRVDETGLVYLGARHYDPTAGRFTTADPVGHSGSMDLYSFANGDPVNFFDPSGRFGKQTGDVASYDAAPSDVSGQVRDYVGEMHRQELATGALNILTLGIADPLSGYLTGYDLNGNAVNQGQAANNLYLATVLALPMLVPGAGEAELGLEAGTGLALRGGGDMLIGAGERGLVDVGEYAFVGTDIRASEGFAASAPTRGLGDVSTSPWLGDARAGVVSHLEQFRNGGSYLVPESVANKYITGQSLIGRTDGQFITTSGAMDKLLQQAGGDLGFVKQKLGIPAQYWNEPLFRVDIQNPLLFNARLPSGMEAGANSFFKWGGYTSGGMPEATIDQIPVKSFSLTPTGIGPK